MSNRLQVIIGDDELREIRALVLREKVSVAERVRRALRGACKTQPRIDARRVLEESFAAGERLFTDAEVFQEILKRYVAINRRDDIYIAVIERYAITTVLIFDHVYSQYPGITVLGS